jgi:hypothetical protein
VSVRTEGHAGKIGRVRILASPCVA